MAFVGSSNLTESALTSGIEWNYRVVSSQEGTPFAEIVAAFERLFHHPATRPIDREWIEAYRARRPAAQLLERVKDGRIEIAPGCVVTYDLRTAYIVPAARRSPAPQPLPAFSGPF